MRVGIVVDNLDRRRGGMSEWCWQFGTGLAAYGFELHVISQAFGNDALPDSIVRHTVPPTISRQAFAAVAEQTVRQLGLDLTHDMGGGWAFDIFQPHGGSQSAWENRRLDFLPPWVRGLKRPIDGLLPRRRDMSAHWQKQCAAMRQSEATIVALSSVVADHFVDLDGMHPAQVEVVHNGVDCERFSPAYREIYRSAVRQRLGIDEDIVVLLLAAHNFRLKGAPELLRVASQLVANDRRVHVLIAGGKRLGFWCRYAAQLKLAGRATFLGTVTNMVPYFAAADAYVHPTYYDPCSLVLLEAAASGLPIVTTRRFNGAAELFRDRDEILKIKDPNDQEALFECVDALFDERYRQQLGQAARRVALRNTIELNVAKIVGLYRDRAPRRVAA
jgi:UDP-glucose:(heptosyl)LPS alpha-1,3-glucosyltransferase